MRPARPLNDRAKPDVAAPDRTRLRLGAFSAVLDGADLRYIRWRDVEVIRRVYVAVRDIRWRTVLPVDVQVDVRGGASEVVVSCRAHHESDPIVFDWEGTIALAADGSMSYEMNGVAGGDFDYAKIGICIHHPMETAGRPYFGTSVHGAVAGLFPDTIAPQIHVGEIDLPVFPPVTSLTVQQSADVSVEITWNGERFELEDHRNWSDASFKSYPKPADLGYRFHAAAGERLTEAVRVVARGGVEPVRPSVRREKREPTHVEIGPTIGRLPAVGLGLASHGVPATDADLALLRAAWPSHLRVDLHLSDGAWQTTLARGLEEAESIGCGLELAVFLARQPELELASLVDDVGSRSADVERVIVLHELEEVTRPLWVAAARGQLQSLFPNARFFGGTNGYFNELNRNRECVAGVDGVAFSLNPQVHAFDDLSLVENLAAQPEIIRTTRSFAGAIPIAVTPITLRPRPASGVEPSETDAVPPFEVDLRQATTFGAAWTVASIGALARAGVSSLTYFETSGWRGIIETELPSHPTSQFTFPPGQPYPLYHVFAEIGRRPESELLGFDVSRNDVVGGIALRVRGTISAGLANLTEHEQDVTVGPCDGDVSVRRLDDTEVPSPRVPTASYGARPAARKRSVVSLRLLPYEVVWLEISARGAWSA